MAAVFLCMQLGLFSVVNFQAELGLFNGERDLFLAGSVRFLHRKTLLREISGYLTYCPFSEIVLRCKFSSVDVC
jgi:hypothetical protein